MTHIPSFNRSQQVLNPREDTSTNSLKVIWNWLKRGNTPVGPTHPKYWCRCISTKNLLHHFMCRTCTNLFSAKECFAEVGIYLLTADISTTTVPSRESGMHARSNIPWCGRVLHGLLQGVRTMKWYPYKYHVLFCQQKICLPILWGYPQNVSSTRFIRGRDCCLDDCPQLDCLYTADPISLIPRSLWD